MTRKFLSSVLYTLAFLLISCAVLITIISYLLKDLKHYTELTLKLVEEKTGYNISIDDIHWSLAQGAGLRIDNLRITDNTHQVLLFSSKRVHILTAFFPLLKKQIKVNKVLFDKPEIFVFREYDGSWIVITTPLVNEKYSKTDGTFFDFSLSLKKFHLRNGKLLYRDKFCDVKADFEHINLEVKQDWYSKMYGISAYAELSPKGSFSIDGDMTFLPFNANFQNLSSNANLVLNSISLTKFMPYLKPILPSAITNSLFDANLNLSLLPEFKFAAHGKVTSSNFSFYIQDRKPVYLGQCIFNIKMHGDRDALWCDHLTFNLPEGVNFNGEFSITKLHEKAPFLDINFDTNWFNTNSLNQFVTRNDVALAPYKDIVQRISDGEIALKNVHIQTHLNKVVPDQISVLYGELSIKNALISTLKNTPPLKIIEADFELNRSTILGILAAQWLSDDMHTLHAEITPVFHNPCFHLTIDSAVPSKALNTVLPEVIDNPMYNGILKTLSGFIAVQTKIGYENKFRISSEIDLTQAGYQIANFVAKPIGLANKLYLKADFTEDQKDPSFSFNFNVDDKQTAFGTIQGWPLPTVKGSYLLQALDITSFELPSLPSTIQLKGTCTGRGSFCFPKPSLSQFPLKGSFSIDGLEIGEPGSNNPLIASTLDTRISEQMIFISKSFTKVGETYFTASGNLTKLVPPRGKLTANAGFYDIDDFVQTIQRMKHISKKKDQESVPPEKSIFRRTCLDMDLKAKKVNFRSWNGDNATSTFSYKNGVMLWEDINIKAGQGIIQGKVVYDFRVPEEKQLNLMPSRSDVDFLWLVPDLKKEELITGRTNLTGTFFSTFSKNEDIVPNMEGDFHISITEGKIRKFTVLSKILSMLNITMILKLKVPDLLEKGMPFDSIQADFEMKKVIMETENLTLKSPAMNLSAVGSIHLLQKEIDLIVGVQPLETIGKIVGTIPIAKNIFTGKDKSLTVGYFHVQGPYKNASVRPLPIKSFRSAVSKIFKSILNIPREILSPKKAKEPHQ